MAPAYIPIPVETISEAEELPSKTYRLDLDAGRIVGKVDGVEAVRQAIRKALITKRFYCLIYDNQYGSEIEDAVIRGDATEDYINAAVEGFVKDALKPDTRITAIQDFSFQLVDDAAYISFTAQTIFGELPMEVVI